MNTPNRQLTVEDVQEMQKKVVHRKADLKEIAERLKNTARSKGKTQKENDNVHGGK